MTDVCQEHRERGREKGRERERERERRGRERLLAVRADMRAQRIAPCRPCYLVAPAHPDSPVADTVGFASVLWDPPTVKTSTDLDNGARADTTERRKQSWPPSLQIADY